MNLLPAVKFDELALKFASGSAHVVEIRNNLEIFTDSHTTLSLKHVAK